MDMFVIGFRNIRKHIEHSLVVPKVILKRKIRWSLLQFDRIIMDHRVLRLLTIVCQQSKIISLRIRSDDRGDFPSRLSVMRDTMKKPIQHHLRPIWVIINRFQLHRILHPVGHRIPGRMSGF